MPDFDADFEFRGRRRGPGVRHRQDHEQGHAFRPDCGHGLDQGRSRTRPRRRVLQQVPVNEIQAVYYEAEPADLKAAKKHALDGHYAEALAALERIKEKPARPEMQQDIEFYKALCSAKLALGGSMKIVDAGRLMRAFADANPKSYHYFEASETVGDLLVAARPVRPGGGILRPARTTPRGPTTRCGRAWPPAGHC